MHSDTMTVDDPAFRSAITDAFAAVQRTNQVQNARFPLQGDGAGAVSKDRHSLIDATIVRAVLLPAVMKLLGERNWYLPRWLGWLPQTSHEPGPAVAPEPPVMSPIST